jgi:hypothetical protein
MGVGTTLKVAAFADDVKSYLANMTEVEYLTTRADAARPGYSYAAGDGPLAVWYGASSQVNSVSKFTIVLLGTMIHAQRPAHLKIKEWVRYGLDEADKNLGLRMGTTEQIAAQWGKMHRVIEQLATDVTAGRRLAGSVYARSALAKGAFASKMFHTFKMQAPCAATRTTVFRNIQKVINQLVFGKFFQIRTDTAQQPYKDGGVSLACPTCMWSVG